MPQEWPGDWESLLASLKMFQSLQKKGEYSKVWNTPLTSMGAAVPALGWQPRTAGGWRWASPSQAQCPKHFSQAHTYVSLIFPRRRKNFEKFLLHPAQNSKLLSSAEVLQAKEDYQGACRHGLPLSPPAPPGDPASWRACIFFPLCSFHFCAFSSRHLMFPSAPTCRGGRGGWASPLLLGYHHAALLEKGALSHPAPLPQLPPSPRDQSWASSTLSQLLPSALVPAFLSGAVSLLFVTQVQGIWRVFRKSYIKMLLQLRNGWC